MDNNHTEDYVLVLEGRTEVQNASKVGKLSIISDINEEGELKTTAAEATNQSSFLKFNNQDGLLKNFMKNFLKQFNDPTRFGLYKVLASNVEQGVESLRSSLQNQHHPASEELLKSPQVSFEDFLPMQKRTTAINPEQIDWRMLEDLASVARSSMLVERSKRCSPGRRVTSSPSQYPTAIARSTPRHA